MMFFVIMPALAMLCRHGNICPIRMLTFMIRIFIFSINFFSMFAITSFCHGFISF